jgi:hypothetical protein
MNVMVNEIDNNNYIPLVPYMPEDPLVGYGYVPYQTNPDYFNNIAEAYNYGTIYPDLTTPYLEYVSGGDYDD